MPLKREAEPFIKPDPDAKRVKREGGDDNFSLSSIPMAPPSAAFASSNSFTIAPKTEVGDHKPLSLAPNYGGATLNNRKRKFGNTIKAWRGNVCVSAHFNKRNMEVDFTIRGTYPKQWPSMEVEAEIFERLNKAKFEIQPAENWGFLDRKVFAHLDKVTTPATLNSRCTVRVKDMGVKKDENFPLYFKKEEHLSQTKSEHLG
ncbi:hypothetical protein J7T55_003133 [Diaporthe amygdali]|uniref:uncharacterized protein n=1 Tax=Phomopsis amygdali TaxID=1214568 RepID=UPI0022FE8042|nr:uncharacterized protein J7T55_003133 [Diaporthe amygdali]KAJ0122618.1 hypothetical protein J7T55_003133 [Diaporthe amygdali]